ncbi:MAG: hypothetical protein WAU39_08245 [Polyangiales bacterium]
MIRSAFGLSLLVSMGVVMTGCGDSGGSACDTGQVECDGVCIPAIEPTLDGVRGIQASVFDVSCAISTSCHGAGGGLQSGLVLSSASVSADNLIDVESTEVDKLRVAPGDTGASYLVDKLLGQNLALGTAQMPNLGQPLCDAKIQAVEDWIAAGAN